MLEPIEPEAVALPPVPGVMHDQPIDVVELCADGSCAVSVQRGGGARLWPRLDGSHEPQPIPLSDATVASAQRSPSGFTVFAATADGAAATFAMDDRGGSKPLGSWPSGSVRRGKLLADGQHLVLLLPDGTLALATTDGRTLASHTPSPAPFVVFVRDDSVVTMSLVDVETPKRMKMQRYGIRTGASRASIAPEGPAPMVTSSYHLDRGAVAVDPDGRWCAAIDYARKSPDESAEVFSVVLQRLDEAAPPRTFEVEFTKGRRPLVGFLGPDRVIASRDRAETSWVYDLKTKKVTRAAPLPKNDDSSGTHTTASGIQVAPYTQWLFVHDVGKGTTQYLGYKAGTPSSVAISPSGTMIAWATDPGVLAVESIDGAIPLTELPHHDSRRNGYTRTRFVDDEHLLVTDVDGGLSVVHWPTAKVLVRDEMRSLVTITDVAVESRLALIVHAKEHLAWTYRIEDDFSLTRVGDPVEGVYRSGLLDPTNRDSAVLWTVGPKSFVSRHALAEGTDGPMLRVLADAPEQRAYDRIWTLDRNGVVYRTPTTGALVRREAGSSDPTFAKGTPGRVEQVLPSPKGDRFAIVEADLSPNVEVFDTKTMERLWSTPLFRSPRATSFRIRDVSWSDDGAWLGVTSGHHVPTTAIVFDAATGEVVRSRRGLLFSVVSEEPNDGRPTL